jgi:hypothetical protein
VNNHAEIPKQIDYEQLILGSCLQYKEAVEFVYSKIDPKDFYDERNMLIYRAIQSLALKEIPVDIATIKSELQTTKNLPKVGIEYLSSIPSGIPNTLNLNHYVSELVKLSRQRNLIWASNNISQAISNGNGDIKTALIDLQKSIDALNYEDKKLDSKFDQLADDRYILHIPNKKISIEVDRLRREHHELIGELCVKCGMTGAITFDGNVSIADFNLSSARARSERAKLLLEKSKIEINWGLYLEQFTQMVLSAERQGLPPTDLRTIEKPKSEDSLCVEGMILPRRHPAILFGDGGAAKSYTALYLAGNMVKQGLTVALFDWELAGEDHRDRLERLFGQSMPKICYARCEKPLVYEIDRLRRIVKEFGIDYAFYDSVAFACDGAPESAEIAGKYFRAVRQIGPGSLHIAHVTKSEGGEDKPFGSVFWHNGSRSTWYAKIADSSQDGKTMSLGLFNKKSNLGQISKPIGFQIKFSDTSTFFSKCNPIDIPELAEGMSIRQRMRHLLKQGALPLEQIAERIGAKTDSVRRTVQRAGTIFTIIDGGKVALLSRDTGPDNVSGH